MNEKLSRPELERLSLRELVSIQSFGEQRAKSGLNGKTRYMIPRERLYAPYLAEPIVYGGQVVTVKSYMKHCFASRLSPNRMVSSFVVTTLREELTF